MNILGHGLDIVEVDRIAGSVEKHGERFLKRIFLPDEVAYAMGNKVPAIHLAVRFAAKEAVSKAFGTGIGEKLGWQDIEIRKRDHGEPFLIFHGKGRTLANQRGVAQGLVTLSHTRGLALASCILVGT